MCRKCKMLLVLVVMLCLAGSAGAYTYSWCSSSGNWGDSARWDVKPSPALVGCALIYNGAVLNVTYPGQGAWDCALGYVPSGATVNIDAGIEWQVANSGMVGHGATGVLNVYGTAYFSGLRVSTSAASSGTINVYDSGSLEIDGGATIGEAGTARVNLRGSTVMFVEGTLTMTAAGRIDIADGFLEVAGNQVAQLTTYKNNGWITAYGGTGTVNTPTYSAGYTTVTTVPRTLPTTYFWSYPTGNWATGSTWNTGTVPIAGEPARINHAFAMGNVSVTGRQGAGNLSIGYTMAGNVNVAAGSDLHIDYYLFVGQTANSFGVFDVYGTAYTKRLEVAYAANTTGTVDVYNGGSLLVGTGACNIGTGGTTSVGRVNLKGNAAMTVMAATGISMGALPAAAKIDIEAGYLKVVGNQVAQLQSYINNGRITGYNGAATIATPVYTGGYTIVAVYPASAASSPNPTNALSMVPLNRTLTWTAGTYATGHDVYWGTNSTAVTNATHTSPEYKGNFSTASYQPADGFGRNIGQTHYWRIDETSGNGAIVRPNGPLWSFHTEHVRPISFANARGITLDRMFHTIPVEPDNTIEVADVRIIRYMGFEFAKVLINPALMISGNNINTTNMAYIDSVMAKFMAEGVPVVICIHPMPVFKTTYLGNWINFTNLCSFYYYFADYLAVRWGVNEVSFQLMTEPSGNAWPWDDMWIHMYDQARAGMPNHTLIMSGALDGRIEGLIAVNPDLRVDNNVLWSFTTYYPYIFTFQGSTILNSTYGPYLDEVPYPASPSIIAAQMSRLLANIPSAYQSAAQTDLTAYGAATWNLTKQRSIIQPITTWKNNHPTSNPKLWCAEFGSLDEQQGGGQGGGVNPAQRIQFISDRRQAFEEAGMGWAYWSYNETFTCFKPTLRVPFTKTPSYDWVDDAETLVALAVRSPGAVYFWSVLSGNWADPNTWDLGVPHTGNTPGHDVFVVDNVTVNSSNQGSTDLHIGYALSGSLNVSAGYTLSITHSILVGQSAGTLGVLNLDGWAIAEHLHVGEAAGSSGTITINSGGYLQIGTWGCDVGSETGGTGLVDLEGAGEMVALSTLAISGTGRIDIESGQLAILGDCRTRMQDYINWGRITGYDSTGTVNTPTFDGTYTRVTAVP